MYAGSAVDLFKHRIGGHYTRERVLLEIQHAQNEILALPEVPLMRNKSVTYLETLADTREYTLAVGIRTVSRVYTRSTSGILSTEYGRVSPFVGGGSQVQISGQTFDECDIDFEVSESVDPETACTLYFAEDVPLIVSTDTYRIDTIRWPVQPISEDIRLELPDPWVTSLLFYAVKKKVEESAYGVDIYNKPEFTEMLTKFTGKMARSKQQARPIRQPRL